MSWPANDREEENRRKAAQYVRISKEHQSYSTENQADAIRRYADERSYQIIKTYSDAGKSGLRIQGRAGLTQLIEDIEGGQTEFKTVLVYDISRWGRFQDADEIAYYEYICKRAGISVEYCAEQFENDGRPMSIVVKGLKRAMAGEYSRELSQKVFAGQSRLIELGYRQGGAPGFGLRRMLSDEAGNTKGILSRDEHKSIQTDRVTLVPGPDEETAVVRQILTNEKYVGNNIWNRNSFKLKKRHVRNDPSNWVRAVGAFEAIVSTDLFEAAGAIIGARSQRMSDEEMLEGLKEKLEQHRFLSRSVINEAACLPSSGAYQSRFGSPLRAHSLVGFKPDRDYRYIEINKRLRGVHADIVRDVVAGVDAVGGTANRDAQTDPITINDEFTVSIVIARCMQTGAGAFRWNIRLDTGGLPDMTIVVRMGQMNELPLDYYLLPTFDMTQSKLRLSENNGLSLDAFRFDDLSHFFAMAARAPLLEVA
ncbi:recombinase family protein [uncultured Roseobacter sp.]|uniref:recombinase family protein n=1 Tax=uncultured Roseobacter sp. TaxID=114847 RepID=UPI002622034A|nr:recombinase family protein [uncultured Roseobacter sp.]